MPFVPTPQGVQCAINFRYLGLPRCNVINIDYGAVPTAGQVEDVADFVLAEWEAEVLPHLSSGYTLLGVDARSLASSESPVATAEAAPATIGGESITVLSATSQALCYTLRTALPGRSRRGRLFICGLKLNPADNDYVDATWAAALHGGLITFFQSVLSGAAGFAFSVLSEESGGVPRTEGVLTHITSVALRNLRVDSQNRRAPRD